MQKLNKGYFMLIVLFFSYLNISLTYIKSNLFLFFCFVLFLWLFKSISQSSLQFVALIGLMASINPTN